MLLCAGVYVCDSVGGAVCLCYFVLVSRYVTVLVVLSLYASLCYFVLVSRYATVLVELSVYATLCWCLGM